MGGGAEKVMPTCLKRMQRCCEGKRIDTIVSNLLSFSSQRSDQPGAASIQDIVERSLSLVGTYIQRSQIALQLDVPEDLPNVRYRS